MLPIQNSDGVIPNHYHENSPNKQSASPQVMRINDKSYQFSRINKGNAQDVVLEVEGVQSGLPTFEIAEKIAKFIKENDANVQSGTSVHFKDKGKSYKLVVGGKQTFLQKVIATLTRMFHFRTSESKVEFRVKETSFLDNFRQHKTVDLATISIDLPGLPTLPIPIHSFEKSPFDNSYTHLSAEAFQKYEPEFAAHDIKGQPSYADHSQYRLIQTGNNLTLTPMNESIPDDGKTLNQYRDFLIKEFGKKKVDYIAHLYHIDLNGKGSLTPEIVYRMNTGMANLEKQDLDSLIHKFDGLSSRLAKGKLTPDKLNDKLTFQELRGIKNLSNNADFNNADIATWLTTVYSKLSKEEKLNRAISILSIPPEYTGRKLPGYIHGSYKIADTKSYKPWVDQQELHQIFEELQRPDISREEYYEKLSFIVVKKHLAREHPTEGYRVGALIPALRDEDGNQRWYVVDSCTSNGKGLLNYTLVPLSGHDKPPPLPALKLFRSTTPDAHVVESMESIANDINFINAPGYEGTQLTKKYEDDFFKKRTIPIWVGYTLASAKELKKGDKADPKEINNSLKEAINAYLLEKRTALIPKSIEDIIRAHDAELIELSQKLMKQNLTNFPTVVRLVTLINQSLSGKKLTIEQDQKNCQFLLSLIPQGEYSALTKDLQKLTSLDHTQKGRLDVLEAKGASLHRMRTEGNYEKVFQSLNKLALKEGEHPSQKIQQSIVTVGHSLGGGAAQKSVVDYYAKANRVPLEGMEIGVVDFDGPGINRGDNKFFKALGRHETLFKELNVKFSLQHHMVKGDFVPLGGEEHLGAVENEEERIALGKWCRFEATVTERLDSSIAELRDEHIAHFQFFAKGKRQAEALFEGAKGLLLGRNIKKDQIEKINAIALKHKGDYSRTWVDANVLYHLDHGTKRVWKDVRQLWKLANIPGDEVESIRKFFGVVIRVLLARYSLLETVQEEGLVAQAEWSKYRDKNGAFAVNLSKGVLSA